MLHFIKNEQFYKKNERKIYPITYHLKHFCENNYINLNFLL